MADQEFLASFGVDIDESGLDRLQKALKENRTLAEQLASAFDSARSAVNEFFKQLSASTLPSGELSPYRRLMEMSEKGISFAMDLETTDADDTLKAFLENAHVHAAGLVRGNPAAADGGRFRGGFRRAGRPGAAAGNVCFRASVRERLGKLFRRLSRASAEGRHRRPVQLAHDDGDR